MPDGVVGDTLANACVFPCSSYSASSVSVPNENSFEEIQERIGGDSSIHQNGIYGGWDEDLEQLLSYHNTDLEAEEDASIHSNTSTCGLAAR